MNETKADRMVAAAITLRTAAAKLKFSEPINYIYNPLQYAWEGHLAYLKKYADSFKRVIFLGMNPGPWGMAQTGVPFGEINAVANWMAIKTAIGKPAPEHPKRPIDGFLCSRSEVSGRRLWQLFEDRFVSAGNFFSEYFVANYCPLIFMEESGRNRTPDKLKSDEKELLFKACDTHLLKIVEIMQPEWLIGVGRFSENRALSLFPTSRVKVGRISHPSPANPEANCNWAGIVSEQMRNLGIW